jgi:hypothetical protein
VTLPCRPHALLGKLLSKAAVAAIAAITEPVWAFPALVAAMPRWSTHSCAPKRADGSEFNLCLGNWSGDWVVTRDVGTAKLPQDSAKSPLAMSRCGSAWLRSLFLSREPAIL